MRQYLIYTNCLVFCKLSWHSALEVDARHWSCLDLRSIVHWQLKNMRHLTLCVIHSADLHLLGRMLRFVKVAQLTSACLQLCPSSRMERQQIPLAPHLPTATSPALPPPTSHTHDSLTNPGQHAVHAVHLSIQAVDTGLLVPQYTLHSAVLQLQVDHIMLVFHLLVRSAG